MNAEYSLDLECRIDPHQMTSWKKRNFYFSLPFVLLFTFLWFLLFRVLTWKSEDESQNQEIGFAIILIGTIQVIRMTLDVGRELINYKVRITSASVIVEKRKGPSTSIYRTEISEIIRGPKGGFLIRGIRNKVVIMIPREIEKHQEVEKALMQIRAIAPSPQSSLLRRNGIAFAYLTLALMIAVYTVENKVAVLITGCLLIILLFWILFRMEKSKDLNFDTKPYFWRIMAFVFVTCMYMLHKIG